MLLLWSLPWLLLVFFSWPELSPAPGGVQDQTEGLWLLQLMPSAEQKYQQLHEWTTSFAINLLHADSLLLTSSKQFKDKCIGWALFGESTDIRPQLQLTIYSELSPEWVDTAMNRKEQTWRNGESLFALRRTSEAISSESQRTEIVRQKNPERSRAYNS